MRTTKSPAEKLVAQSQKTNLAIFLGFWAVTCIALALLRNNLPAWGVPLTSYQLGYMLLSTLAIGLVVVLGILPDTRFGPPLHMVKPAAAKEIALTTEIKGMALTNAVKGIALMNSLESKDKTVAEAWDKIEKGLQLLEERKASRMRPPEGTPSQPSQPGPQGSAIPERG